MLQTRILIVLSLIHLSRAYPLNSDAIQMEEIGPSELVVSNSPLVIIPGDGGSQAYADFKNKTNEQTARSFSLWINLDYFWYTSAFCEYFGLTYDPVTHTTSDNKLLDIQFPGWGETWSIENLDVNHHSATQYFLNMVNQLVKDPFYVRNATLRGAPYDFRRAPNENTKFFTNLKSLIEETYQNSGGRRVVLLGHSMGNLYTLYFLRNQSEQWKKQFIRGYIAVSAPLAGAVKAMRLEASGDNFGIFVERSLWFRPTQRSLVSTAFLMPYTSVWGPDEPIIVTPQRNYSAHDYKEFFTDIGFDNGYLMRTDTENLVDSLAPPTGVDELYCIHGNDIQTDQQLVYSHPSIIRPPFPDQDPTIVYGDGDGTVNMRSLELCSRWPGVDYHIFKGAEHMKIVQSPEVIDYVRQILIRGDKNDVLRYRSVERGGNGNLL